MLSDDVLDFYCEGRPMEKLVLLVLAAMVEPGAADPVVVVDGKVHTRTELSIEQLYAVLNDLHRRKMIVLDAFGPKTLVKLTLSTPLHPVRV